MRNLKKKSRRPNPKTGRAVKLESLSVPELRQVARSMRRMPLTPNEISTVRRKRLMKAIKNVMDMD